MKPDKRSLRDLLADASLYGEGQGKSDGTWRELLLSRQPRRARSRIVSRAAETRRLILLVALPVAAIVLVALISYYGLPSLPGADAVKERVTQLTPPSPPSLLSWPGLPALKGIHLPGGHYLWLLPLGLSALLTLRARGRITRLLPVDW